MNCSTRWIEDRRRASKGVALLGLRGAGKTTLGRLLADRHGLAFVSITREIETRAGMSLADLFNLGGPDAYRASRTTSSPISSRRGDRIVLETAGGIVGNSEALDIILGAFKTVWLKASPEEHLARVAGQGDTRPMRGNPKALEHLRSLLGQREPEYARAEHVDRHLRPPGRRLPRGSRGDRLARSKSLYNDERTPGQVKVDKHAIPLQRLQAG